MYTILQVNLFIGGYLENAESNKRSATGIAKKPTG